MIPFQGHKFLRFSSKISGFSASTTGAEHYILEVTQVARAHFGSRVQSWHEARDQYGHYGWDEVFESFKTYEHVWYSFVTSPASVNLK